MTDILFRTRNLGQHFLDISKKKKWCKPSISVIYKWQLLKITSKFSLWHQKSRNQRVKSWVIFNKSQVTHICQLNVSCGQDSVSEIVLFKLIQRDQEWLNLLVTMNIWLWYHCNLNAFLVASFDRVDRRIWRFPSKGHFCNSINIPDITYFFLMSCQVKTSGLCQLRCRIFFNCFIANRLSHCWSRCRISTY
jgi:hypothetical protein